MAIKETDVLLTTKDNEFNPFTQYDDWKNFDENSKHYCTEAYVARVVGFLDEDISDTELAFELNRAFDEIIQLNNEMGFDIYVKVSRDGTRIGDAPSRYLEALKEPVAS